MSDDVFDEHIHPALYKYISCFITFSSSRIYPLSFFCPNLEIFASSSTDSTSRGAWGFSDGRIQPFFSVD